MKIQRYEQDSCSDLLYEHAHGDWVRYDDALALAQQLERELAEALSSAASWSRLHDRAEERAEANEAIAQELRAELKRKDEALRELFDSTASVRFDLMSRLGWRLACETSAFKRQHAAMAVAEPLVQQIRAAALAQGGKEGA